MRLLLVFVFAMGQWMSGMTQSVSHPIDASHSVISFSVGFAGGITSIDGRFNQFEGEVGYKNKSDKGSFFANITINAKSINTGDAQRDEDLNGSGYFNTEEFPEIKFESKEVRKEGNGWLLVGSFSMMGKTSDIEIPFNFQHKPSVVWVLGEPRIAAKGSFTIDRIAYGIPQRGWDNLIPSLGSLTLSKEVNIKLVIQGVGPSLATLLSKKIEQEGTRAAIDYYTSLEKEADKDTYNFGDRTLVGIVMALAGGDKTREAIDLGKFTTEKYGDSFVSWYGLAFAHQNAGNKDEAIKYYEKSLELNPKFGRAKAALDELKK